MLQLSDTPPVKIEIEIIEFLFIYLFKYIIFYLYDVHKLARKRCVFNCDFNDSRLVAVIAVTGSEFFTRGAAYDKRRWVVFIADGGTFDWSIDADRSDLCSIDVTGQKCNQTDRSR